MVKVMALSRQKPKQLTLQVYLTRVHTNTFEKQFVKAYGMDGTFITKEESEEGFDFLHVTFVNIDPLKVAQFIRNFCVLYEINDCIIL